MATLTNSDYTEIRQIINANSAIDSAFKGWGLSKPVWKAAFQAAENWFVGGFNTQPTTSFKAAIEAVTGATTSLRAQAVASAWIKWSNKVL